MKLTKPTKKKDIKRKWHLIDLDDKVLGRVASQISALLIGKSKPYYVSNLDCGDYVVVINSRKVKVTGKKQQEKIYMRYSGYPSGLKKKTYAKILEENPKRIIFQAVKGMLPKNKLQASMLKRLYVFTDDNHPYKDKFISGNN